MYTDDVRLTSHSFDLGVEKRVMVKPQPNSKACEFVY